MPGLAQCKKCGASLTGGSLRFCTNCGAALPERRNGFFRLTTEKPFVFVHICLLLGVILFVVGVSMLITGARKSENGLAEYQYWRNNVAWTIEHGSTSSEQDRALNSKVAGDKLANIGLVLSLISFVVLAAYGIALGKKYSNLKKLGMLANKKVERLRAWNDYQASNFKQCPYCLSHIPVAAAKCAQCGSSVAPGQ